MAYNEYAVGGAMPGPVTDRRMGGNGNVAKQMHELEEAVIAMHDAITSLEMALSPVLLPVPPKPSDDAKNTASPVRSLLVESLDDTTGGVRRAINRVNAIRDQLDL